jgi:hypothetical protein
MSRKVGEYFLTTSVICLFALLFAAPQTFQDSTDTSLKPIIKRRMEGSKKTNKELLGSLPMYRRFWDSFIILGTTNIHVVVLRNVIGRIVLFVQKNFLPDVPI